MTPDQFQKFRLFGCVPRCLIQLAAIKGEKISSEEFCKRYESHFINPAEQYGLMSYEAVLPVLQDFTLAKSVAETADYDCVKHEFNVGKRMVLVRSLVNLSPGASDDIDHVSVLHAITDNGFTLWTPSQDGGDYVLPPFDKSDWTTKKCSAKIFS